MAAVFLKLLNLSISASWLVLAVLVLRLISKRSPKWVNVLLWGIVALRLVLPFSIESALSLIPSAETVSPAAVQFDPRRITSGVSVIDNAVNPSLASVLPPCQQPASTRSMSGQWQAGCGHRPWSHAALCARELSSAASARECIAPHSESHLSLRCHFLAVYPRRCKTTGIYLPSGLDEVQRQILLARGTGIFAA